MKVGAPRLRAPSRLAALAPCPGQMATCGKITGLPDRECIYDTDCAASYAPITSQQKDHSYSTMAHSGTRGCLSEMRDAGNMPQKYQQTKRHWLLYSVNSPQCIQIWQCSLKISMHDCTYTVHKDNNVGLNLKNCIQHKYTLAYAAWIFVLWQHVSAAADGGKFSHVAALVFAALWRGCSQCLRAHCGRQLRGYSGKGEDRSQESFLLQASLRKQYCMWLV